jgi:hypothetical protein
VTRVFADVSIEPAINNPDDLTAFIGKVKMTFLSYPFPLIEPGWECSLPKKLE